MQPVVVPSGVRVRVGFLPGCDVVLPAAGNVRPEERIVADLICVPPSDTLCCTVWAEQTTVHCQSGGYPISPGGCATVIPSDAVLTFSGPLCVEPVTIQLHATSAANSSHPPPPVSTQEGGVGDEIAEDNTASECSDQSSSLFSTPDLGEDDEVDDALPSYRVALPGAVKDGVRQYRLRTTKPPIVVG